MSNRYNRLSDRYDLLFMNLGWLTLTSLHIAYNPFLLLVCPHRWRQIIPSSCWVFSYLWGHLHILAISWNLFSIVWVTKPPTKGLPVSLMTFWACALLIISVHLSGLGYQHIELFNWFRSIKYLLHALGHTPLSSVFLPCSKKIVSKVLCCQKDTFLRDDLQLSLFKKQAETSCSLVSSVTTMSLFSLNGSTVSSLSCWYPVYFKDLTAVHL